MLLRRALWHRGVRYRLHTKLPGTPDVAVPHAKLAIFVDACFWHGCPDHYTAPVRNSDYWQSKIARNRARDLRVDSQLHEGGWAVVRVWEHELRRSVDEVATRIVKLIEERTT
jgi:DNA mismatch endonuclease (patch repair protein)